MSSGFRSGILARTDAVEDIHSLAFPVGEAGGEARMGKSTVPMVRGGSGMVASPGLPVRGHLQDGFQGLQASMRRQFVAAHADAPLTLADLAAVASYRRHVTLHGEEEGRFVSAPTPPAPPHGVRGDGVGA